eukprot:SAG31_NODE_211_length_20274_cov_40.333482_14_plen_85_part_00
MCAATFQKAAQLISDSVSIGRSRNFALHHRCYQPFMQQAHNGMKILNMLLKAKRCGVAFTVDRLVSTIATNGVSSLHPFAQFPL